MVTASDGRFESAASAVSINVFDINNHAPVFTPEVTAVRLNKSVAIGYTVTTVTATDADFGINANIR